MASTYSDRLKLEIMETGANAGTWGNNTNNNLEVLDAFSAGYLSKSVAGSANVTLTTANADSTAESSNKVIDLNGALTGDIHVFIPAVENNYVVFNNTTGSQTLTVAATGHAANGTTIEQGAYHFLYCDGSANFNVEKIFSKIGSVEIKGNVNVTADANVTGNVNVTVDANVTGNVNVTAALNVSGASSLDDSVTINESGADKDTRIESSGNANMLLVDGGNDVVGIGKASPEANVSLHLANSACADIGTLGNTATVTPNLAQFQNYSITLDQAATLANATNATAGTTGSLFIVQDGTGGHSLSYGAAYDFPAGTAPTLTTTANTVSRLDYIVKDSGNIHVVATDNYS